MPVSVGLVNDDERVFLRLCIERAFSHLLERLHLHAELKPALEAGPCAFAERRRGDE